MFKLNSPVSSIPLIGSIAKKRLENLNIFTVEDLINHVPHRYIDLRFTSKISKVQPGETVTIKGRVTSMKNQYTRSRKKIQFGKIADSSGELDVIWFNQPFLIRSIKPKDKISLSGKVDIFGNKKTLISPQFEILKPGKATVHTGRLVPVYHETKGVSSKWIRSRVFFVLPLIEAQIQEYLPNSILKKNGYINLSEAYYAIHFPINLTQAQKARDRLSFNELLLLQIKNENRRLTWQKNDAVYKLKVNRKELKDFLTTLPFSLTASQKRSLDEILRDMEKEAPMNRLLEGDVGSGKTVVAAASAFIAFANGHQTVFMAPTQILAQQHYETLTQVFSPFNVRVALVTSSKLKRGPGKTDVFVGTHALIHKKVDFDNVAYVVIDEQHRFGVEQRAHLITKTGKKKLAPHVLTMTATPIPRTIALSVYGDLDLSTLDELPKGRQKIVTWIVPPAKRENAYLWVKTQIKKEGIQAFVICPIIEDSVSESMKQVKAATSTFEDLKKPFHNFNLGLLHGRLKTAEKERVMRDFKGGKIDLLVATPVVEVGIDVANATIMVIEAAERYGLAQLHQLRGRVGRGKKKSYCLLFTQLRSRNVSNRLSALQKTLSGFELAELDLKMRGPGEIYGTRQHGFFDLKIANWNDKALIKKTKVFATDVLGNPKKYEAFNNKLKLNEIAPN